MPKKIESHKDLNILLRADRGVFAVNLRPISDGQPTFQTKAEAVAHARDMFDRYMGKKPLTVAREWTIQDAFDAFGDHLNAKVEDPDVKYGSGTKDGN